MNVLKLEHEVLRWCLENHTWINKTDKLLFSDGRSEIFNAMSTYWSNNIEPTYELLRRHFDDLNEWTTLEDLSSVGSAERIDQSIYQVNKQKLTEVAINRLYVRIQNSPTDAIQDPKIWNGFMDDISRLHQQDTTRHETARINLFDFQSRQKTNDDLINIGISALMKTGTAPTRSDLFQLIAPPNEGKSTTKQNIAMNCALQGLNVLILTFEDTANQYVNRLDQIILNKTQWQMQQMEPEDIERAYTLPPIINDNLEHAFEVDAVYRKSLMERLGQIEIIRDHSYDIEDIVGLIEDFKKRYDKDVDVLIIDYSADLTSREFKSDRSDEVLSHIFKELKAIGLDYNLLAITSTQSNREGLNRNGKKVKVELSNASGSLGGPRKSDIVMSIRMRPIANKNDDKDLDKISPDIATAIIQQRILKKRRGNSPNGSSFYFWMFPSGRLQEIEHDDPIFDKINDRFNDSKYDTDNREWLLDEEE